MTLKLSVQFARAMKRAKTENERMAREDDPLKGWRIHRQKIETTAKIVELTKKVKALKARRLAVEN